jgi:quercetin dioxygenase-like cupin family protein
MAIIRHDDVTLPIGIGTRSRLPSRKLITEQVGARHSELWEQFMPEDGEIPLHYHPVEEIVTFLTGQVEVTIGTETTVVTSPASVFIPPEIHHGFRTHGAETVHLLAFFPTSNPQTLYTE